MITLTVVCDECGRDLSEPPRSVNVDYRIDLYCIGILNPNPDENNFEKVARPFSRPYHFCGMTCLEKALSGRKIR